MHRNLSAQNEIFEKRYLTELYIVSSVISILMLATSVAGLLFRNMIYPKTEIIEAFVPNDVVNLCIGLPILLISMWLTRRGRFTGPMLWLGALIYVAYNYTVYAFTLEPSWIYLAYPSLVMLSIYSLVVLYLAIDKSAGAHRLEGHVPKKLSAGILLLFGIAFLLTALSNIAGAVTGGPSLSRLRFALNVTDSVFTPVWIICGISLWRCRNFGYVMGLGMLFQASMLFIGLMVFLLVQPLVTDAPFLFFDAVVVFVMGFISFIPFAMYLKGVTKQDSI